MRTATSPQTRNSALIRHLGSFLTFWRNSRRHLPSVAVQLATTPGPKNFVEPNPDYRAVILNAQQEKVAAATFGISPLNDTVYLYQIEVESEHRRQGYALAFLTWLYRAYELPITPVHIVGSARGFWHTARHSGIHRLMVNEELRTGEMDAEKARWSHLIPEPEHIRLQRSYEAKSTPCKPPYSH